MANYNSNLHPENDTGSVVFPNINGQSIPENAITPSKVAAGQFPQVVAGSVQNPLTIITAEGQTEYDGSDAATIDISSIQTVDHAYTADRATADADGNNIPTTYAKQDGSYPTLTSGQAKILTKSIRVGNITAPPSGVGYYQFLTCAQLSNYQQANIRLEFSDVNIANSEESPCGIELRYHTSPTFPNHVDVKVLYGDPAILNNVYISVTDNAGISLYFYNTGTFNFICVKALYQDARRDGDAYNIFENMTDYISELPSANTNTALPDLPHYSLITQAASAVNDGNGLNIADNYALQDGDYETLGAGYLSRYGYVKASAMAWYKIATVDISQEGFQYNSYSCRLLVNGIHATQQFAHPNRSGDIELDIRYDGGSIDANQTGITVLSGNLDPNDFCITISGNVVILYVHMPYQSAQSEFTIVQEACENTPIAQILNFDIENVDTTAPSGAIYAKVRNGADHLVLPAAVGSTTTPVYFNADGVPQPCTLPVSKYYNHTFTYQPSKLVQASDFSFIFSVVLDVATPIPAGNTMLWGTYLNLPQTSLAPMPLNSKFFPATGIIKQDKKVGHIMGVSLAAQPLGVNLIASIYYECNGTTGVYPASNSHVVLDPTRISESTVTP